ncbi:hypothetical protein MHL31_13445 [Lutibacter sp. A80]|uniref:hypothetical protein n=1 Tax=Lutibacter sp. A80 TaxID=2918453 RepID=UPI001F058B19|nr:hypothetical protein [Lutibacter sp. A80]UMB60076.1 hypothetical protein MHL31_13445 [Lutibacter sp. A80]
MKKITLTILTNSILFLALFFSIEISAQSSDCDIEITAYRNTTIKDVSSKGSYYKMTMVNKGSSEGVYVLTSKDVNNTCSNVDSTSTENNVFLNYRFLDKDKNPIDKISLSIGESIDFLIYVTAPTGTSMNKWSCVQIIASSENCENYSKSIILKSFIIDPSEG